MKYRFITMGLLLALVSGTAVIAQGQTSFLQEEQDYRFATQLAAKGMYDLAAHQFTQYADHYSTSPRAAEALFNAAENYELLKDHAKASSTYMRLLLSYPQSTFADKALFNQGKILAASGDFLNAALTFERIRLFVAKSELIPLASLEACSNYHRAGQISKALDAAQYVIANYPAHPLLYKARYEVARLQRQLQRPTTALQELEKIPVDKSDPDLRISISLLKGQILNELGQYAHADSVLVSLLDNSAVSDSIGVAALGLARSLFYRGLTDKSLNVIEKSLALNLDKSYSSQLRILQGDNYMAVSDYHSALKALDLAGGDLSPWEETKLSFRRGVLQERMGDKALAIGHYAQVLNHRDSTAAACTLRKHALIAQTSLLAELGNIGEALRTLRTRFDEYPHLRDAILLQRARIQLNLLQDSFSARRSLGMLLDLYPDSPLVDDAQWLMAETGQAQQDVLSAIREYARYATLYPGGDYITEANARLYYLRTFVPLQTAAGKALENVLLQHLADRPSLAVAKMFMDDQHDYATAHAVLRSLHHSDELAASDRKELLILSARAHALLCEKYEIEKDSLQSALQLDSLVLIQQQVAQEFAADAETQQIGQLVRLAKWRWTPPSFTRVSLADTLLAGKLDSETADLLRFDQARFWYKMGSDSNSVVLLRRANLLLNTLAGETNSPEMAARAGLLQYKTLAGLQQPDSALQKLEAVLAQYPQTQVAATAALDLAHEYERKDRLAEAGSLYEDWARHYFYSERAHEVQAKACQMLFKQKRYAEARACIETSDVRTAMPDLAPYMPKAVDDELLWLSAQTSLLQTDASQAILALKTYLVSSPQGQHRGEAFMLLAELYAKTKNYQAALGHYDELVNAHTKDDTLAGQALIRKADLLYAMKDFKNAQNTYVQVKSSSQGEIQQLAAQREVICEYKIGSIVRARTLAEAFRKQYKDRNAEAEFIYEDGHYCFNNKDFRCAEDQFKELGSKYKDLVWGAEGELSLARLYVLLNRTEEALKLLTTMPNRYSDPRILALAYVNLGEFYYENRQLENCMAAARSALEYPVIGPERQRAMELLIRVYDDLRIWDNAVVLLRQYIQDYPDDESTFNRKIQLGIFLINLKEYDRGVAYLRELLPFADTENEAEIQYWIAKAYSERGDNSAAITEFLKVKYACKPSKLPWGTTALYEAGQIYVKLGQLPLARNLFNEIVKELGTGDQFGRVANERVREIDAELAKSKGANNG